MNKKIKKENLRRIVRIMFTFGLTIIFLISCNKNNNVFENVEKNPIEKERVNYEEFKSLIQDKKYEFKNKTCKEINDYLFEQLDKEMYYYWKDTKWDFNGVTQIPKDGSIACGYFVTTVLRDFGFNIQRVRLAQAASSIMINELCTNIKKFSSIDKLQDYLKTQPDKLVYIIGLDFHTGFILKDKSGIYFFHSSYVERKGVVKEKISESKALSDSKTFMIGSITDNKNLLKKWIDKPE